MIIYILKQMHQETVSEIKEPFFAFQPSQIIQGQANYQCLSTQFFFYYLFVNSKSGNKQGRKFITLSNQITRFEYPDDNQVGIVEVFDLFDQSNTKQGFLKIKEAYESHHSSPYVKFRIIVCGGDGTLNWVLSLAIQNGINLEKIPIGILPIGTGNDFSRSLGWGVKTITFDKKSVGQLRRIIKLWNNAIEENYDIWDCQITTYKSGHFCDVKNQQQRKISETIFRKTFTNYVGLGLDARIVYQVERNRGRNAFFNKILYSLVGTINFCKYLKPIDQYITDFIETDDCHSTKSNYFKQEESTETGIKVNCSDVSDSGQEKFQKSTFSEKFNFKKGHRGLVCLNCTSYMSGIRNVWQTKKTVRSQEDYEYADQNTHDGLIEFMTFENQLSLALERIMRKGHKLAQGSGPFVFEFKEADEGDNQTFLEIDGESLKVINIREMRISKSTRFTEGKIKVIKRQNIK